MCTATLKITDGTTTVNLLDPDSGILLDSWIPALPGWKSGGIYTNNQLAEGRILQDARRDNITESMTLNVRNTSMDAVIRDSQNLRRLLEKAVQYWTTNWQNDPVWIEAKGKEETNTRYAVIVNYATPSDVNPYAQPFAATRLSPYLMNGLALVLEHQPWTGNEPGTGTDVYLSTARTFYYDPEESDIPIGQSATTDPVIVATKNIMADITDVYTYDNSTATLSGNYIANPATQFWMFPVFPGVNDYLLIGINDAADNSGPFDSVVFNVFQIQEDLTLDWEYWNGAAWVGLTIRDYTRTGAAESFTNAGMGIITFDPPPAWSNAVMNGYYIRCRITAVGGTPASPEHSPVNVYTVIKAYADVDSAQVPGDIHAIAKYAISTAHTSEPTNAFIATRSIDRGADFSAYLNISDEQNSTGVTVAVGAGAGSIADYNRAPTGRAYLFNPAAYPSTNTVTITINTALSTQYEGRYYAMLRGALIGAAGNTTPTDITIGATNSDDVIEVEYMNVANRQFTPQVGFSHWECIELGTVEIPHTVSPQDIVIEIDVSNGVTSAPFPDLYLTDFILVPVDEFVARCDASDKSISPGISIDEDLIITSIASPKDVTSTYIYNYTDTKLIQSWDNIPGAITTITNNKTQRVWLFTATQFLILAILELSMQINPRYLSMRGDR